MAFLFLEYTHFLNLFKKDSHKNIMSLVSFSFNNLHVSIFLLVMKLHR